MNPVMFMRLEKLRQSIEKMPRPAYIFLKTVLALCAGMLLLSAGLFAWGGGRRDLLHLAQLLLESPAGLLLLCAVGLAALLDRLE